MDVCNDFSSVFICCIASATMLLLISLGLVCDAQVVGITARTGIMSRAESPFAGDFMAVSVLVLVVSDFSNPFASPLSNSKDDTLNINVDMKDESLSPNRID